VIPRTLPILTAFEQRFDFIVVSQERHEKIAPPVLEDKTQREVGATLKKLLTQFSNAEAAVHMRLAEAFR
jgi:hypothetical protein